MAANDDSSAPARPESPKIFDDEEIDRETLEFGQREAKEEAARKKQKDEELAREFERQQHEGVAKTFVRMCMGKVLRSLRLR